MGGLGFLLTIILYVVIAVFAVRAFKRRRAKIIAAVVAILLPTTDAVVGRIYLKHLCDTEGGLKVHRVVKNVDGFMWDGAVGMRNSDAQDKQFLSEFGASFIESSPQAGGKVNRLSLQDGRVVREKGVLPRSTYGIRSTSSEYKLAYLRDQRVVVSIKDGEVIASDTRFIFKGGWAEFFLGYFADSGPGSAAWCEGPDSWTRLRHLVAASLNNATPPPGK